MKTISETDLYSFIKCPHRVSRDAFDDPGLKDSPNEFVQLLCEKGVAYERDVSEKQRGKLDILDLSGIPRWYYLLRLILDREMISDIILLSTYYNVICR